MGWREVLCEYVLPLVDNVDDYHDVVREEMPAVLLSMPAADRIAMARELLAGTGGGVPDEAQAPSEHDGTYYAGRREGWNACRAKMLGDGE